MKATISESPSRQELDLTGHQRLLVERYPSENILKLIGPDGQIRLTLHVTDSGPVLHLEGPGLTLMAAGELKLEAKTLSLSGRERVSVSSGGNLLLEAKGDVESSGRILNLTANLGNVNVRANDDVKLNGERILMNC